MKEFKKYYTLPVPPDELYLALTNPLTIQLWTGCEATMSTEPGSEFALWDSGIVGKNLSFIENKQIEQEWYFDEQENPSIVTIKLHEHAQGTSMEVRQSNIPDEAYEDISTGWTDTYIAALEDFFEEE